MADQSNLKPKSFAVLAATASPPLPSECHMHAESAQMNTALTAMNQREHDLRVKIAGLRLKMNAASKAGDTATWHLSAVQCGALIAQLGKETCTKQESFGF